MLKVLRIRVQNFRNIEDSGWVPIERVTALVGRNESGKTTLLKALHKFNPATPEPYFPQREFPRDRYTHDFKNGSDWPVCSVEFDISSLSMDGLEENLQGGKLPSVAIGTRYYDGTLKIRFDEVIIEKSVSPKTVVEALTALASAARRIPSQQPEQEETIQTLRTQIASWASNKESLLKNETDLWSTQGVHLLTSLCQESEKFSNPLSADIVEAFLKIINETLSIVQSQKPLDQIRELVRSNLPVFIYFENYGILDSAIYLPRFIEELSRNPNDSRTRTINAMFKHVGLNAAEINELGNEKAIQAKHQNQTVTADIISQDQQRKEARAIKLNSASLDISERFNEWYGQRRHTIDYLADGDYFRIWVADERRPGVRIELESRSKGFQWFFSFYLVFLVESAEGHKDAILLLDEPGLHLHPTAQQGLIAFFERLSEKNQLLYSTHSPFLIDGEHIHRVRPVTEDRLGHSTISAETWPADRDTIFPLQAAAGYAMIKGLFQHKNNILVEGMSDYYYLHALNQMCRSAGRTPLTRNVYITPCGGTKMVGHLASLFLGQEIRPLVLLDSDDAGKQKQSSLLKELYSGHTNSILMLDDALSRSGLETEIEDIFGESILLPAFNEVLKLKVNLTTADKSKDSFPSQVKNWASRSNETLPEGWKSTLALYLVSSWAESKSVLSDSILDMASRLFSTINERFQ
ncbi:MAG: ATP-binding protein [bacterium]|nr:ATP-binding protein [bacterium]